MFGIRFQHVLVLSSPCNIFDSVGKLQLVMQDVMAMEHVDLCFVLPALAGQFTGDDSAMFGNRSGEFLGQIKIAPDAFIVGASDPEHGFGVFEVNDVLELTVLGNTFWVVVGQVHDQRLQLSKLVRETGRGFDPFAFLMTVFSPETDFLSIHYMATFLTEFSGN
jgi:hypothetical protein